MFTEHLTCVRYWAKCFSYIVLLKPHDCSEGYYDESYFTGKETEAQTAYLPRPWCSPVEGLHTAQELLVVTAVDEHLSVVFDWLREHGEWPRVKLLLLPLLQLLWGHLTLGLVEETPEKTSMEPTVRRPVAWVLTASPSASPWHISLSSYAVLSLGITMWMPNGYFQSSHVLDWTPKPP